jgi:hypothetical protein
MASALVLRRRFRMSQILGVAGVLAGVLLSLAPMLGNGTDGRAHKKLPNLRRQNQIQNIEGKLQLRVRLRVYKRQELSIYLSSIHSPR